METQDILDLYDRQVRARPRALPRLTLEQIDGTLLLTGLFNFVCHWDFADEDAATVVARLAARSWGGPGALTWDIYGHDRPAGLGDRLAAAGFVQEHVSTLMLMDLEVAALAMPPGIEVRRVTDQAGLRDFVRVSAEAFGK